MVKVEVLSLEEEPLILPYALEIDKKGWIRGFTEDVEAALFLLFLERERKRTFKKAADNSQITLLAKIYYSAWITPWRDGRGLMIDGLGLFPQTIYYDELPDSKTFINELEKANSAEEYLDTLRRHALTFFTVKASRPFIVSLISKKDLVADLQSYIIHYKRGAVTNALSLNPRVSWQQASTFMEMLNGVESEIEGLNAVKERLTTLSSEWVRRQKEAVEDSRREYLTRIEEEKVKAKLDELRAEYQSMVAELEKKLEEEVKALRDEGERLRGDAQRLQQKKDEYFKMIDDLRQLREALLKPLNEPRRRRNEISSELTNQIAKLEALKMERLRLEDLAEGQKGVASELSVTRQRISQINLEIDAVNELILKLKKELKDEDEKHARLQEDLVKLSKQIADVEKAIKGLDASIVENRARQASIPHQIEDVKKRGHEEILKVDRDYRLKFDEIRGKINTLQLEMTRRIEAEQRLIEEMVRRTDEIIAQIEKLVEIKRSFIQSFQAVSIYLPKSLEVTAPTLIQIPLYLLCFETLTDRKHILYTPIVVKEVSKIPWLKKVSLETMLKNFDQIVKSRLYEAMEQDCSFEEDLLNSCSRLNLLSNSDFLAAVFKGLTQLKNRAWISTSEADRVMAMLYGPTLPVEEKKGYAKLSFKILR